MTVDLMPEWKIGDLLLTSYPYGVDADSTVDIGEPEMVVESVTSMLVDGDSERVSRHGNRTYVLEVYVEGPTLADLASAEAALRSELRRSGLLLTHNPGDGFSPASVYEVWTAKLTPSRDDSHESHLIRKFTLTLTCAPWARSAEPVTVEAMTSGTTTVVVDACDSATGWTGLRNGVPTSAEGPSTIWEAGSVGIMELSNTVGFPPETWELIRTGAIDMSSTPFLSVEVTTLSAKAGAPLDVSVFANGVRLPALQSTKMTDGSNYFRLVLDATAVPAVSTLTFVHTSAAGYGHAWQGLQVRNVARTDVAPNITARQLTRTIEVGGTERTPASIHAQTADGTGGLGVLMVHTHPADGSGYSPPLRRWRVSGNDSTISSVSDAMSGSYERIHPDPFVAEVPTSALPEGGYLLMARLVSDVAGTIDLNWSLHSKLAGSPYGMAGMEGSTKFHFYTANVYHFAPLTLATLPTLRGAGDVRVGIQYQYGGANIFIDDAWLFRVDDGCALTIVNTPPAHVWLDSPDTSSPVPTVWWGTAADRSDARHPGTSVMAMGTHVLDPDGTTIFTGALSDNVHVDAKFFRRWHSNAAE